MKADFDILKILFEKAIDKSKIEEFSFTAGAKYVAALSPQKKIGVCATLGVNVLDTALKPNLEKAEQRILANAAANSVLNYNVPFDGDGDIFQVVDFDKYKSISMIGYFCSLVKKFEGKDIKLNIFDIDQHEAPVIPMSQQKEYLKDSDCVIVTSTSISNNTFTGIVNNIPNSCDVYMLGPSTPLDDEMFSIPQVKGLFGSVFETNDTEVLNIIKSDGGTRVFMPRMKKVYRIRK